MTKGPPDRDTREGAREGRPQTKGDMSADNATPNSPDSNNREGLPGANPDTPWLRTTSRVAPPLWPVKVPGDEGGS